MALKVVQKASEVPESVDGTWVVGFFGAFSRLATEARPDFEAFATGHPELPVYLVDVGEVRGVHQRFGVSSVPEAVAVVGGAVIRRASGHVPPEAWARALLPHDGAPAATQGNARPVPIVYTTPTCSWCTRVKQWTDDLGITYREVDVARDAAAARSLVERSGQMGVPQIEIGGRSSSGSTRPDWRGSSACPRRDRRMSLHQSRRAP